MNSYFSARKMYEMEKQMVMKIMYCRWSLITLRYTLRIVTYDIPIHRNTSTLCMIYICWKFQYLYCMHCTLYL